MGEMLLQVPVKNSFSAQPLAVLGVSRILPDGTWVDPVYREGDDANRILLSPLSVTLNYAGGLFEGMKAWKHPNGNWYLVQPAENAKRMIAGMNFMSIPPFSVEWFVNAILETVRRTLRFVHPNVTELYIRPVVIPTGEKLGLGSPFVSPDAAAAAGCWSQTPGYTFFVFVTPVGSYFDPTQQASLLMNPHWQRAVKDAARHKLSSNYPMNAVHMRRAAALKCTQVLYLNPDKTVGECGAANVACLVNGVVRVCSPTSPYVLQGTTQQRILQLLRRQGISVVEVPAHFFDDTIDGLTMMGTAAGCVPVHTAKVLHADDGSWKLRPVSQQNEIFVAVAKKYDGILRGEEEDVFGWLVPVEG